MRQKSGLGLFMVIIVVITATTALLPLAHAHPFTQETIPAESSNAEVGLTQVIVSYSEEIEIEFSSLRVFNDAGDQIDNRDTQYHNDEKTLLVTTPPLEKGVYTVTSKVLSRVDGHLIPDAFVFGVGDVAVSSTTSTTPTELILYPEAAARFPGLVGQTIVLGIIIGSILIWATQRKEGFIKTELKTLETVYKNKFLTMAGIGIAAVFASNIGMLVLQAIRLDISPLNILETLFGQIWLARMILTIAVLIAWIILRRNSRLSIKSQIPMLIISLILIATTTAIGHGAATEQTGAVILDYIHNLVAAAWIGGVIFFAFILLPSFTDLRPEYREKISLLMMPRFSIIAIISVGIIIISGPILMWFLESDVDLIVGSLYGQLIIAKIMIAAMMVGIGAYNQIIVQQKAEDNLDSNTEIHVHKKLKHSLKIEAVLGVVLLGVVALLVNGTLPAGEVQAYEPSNTIMSDTRYGLSTTEFSESTQFFVDIYPFTSGSNTIKIKVTDSNGESISDLDTVKAKLSNPEKSITPIEIPLTKIQDVEGDEFEGEAVFGFSGKWLVEIEAQKSLTASESIEMDLLIKPRLENLRIEITEYDLPEEAEDAIDPKPLYPVYDDDGYIWISELTKPVLWRFSIEQETFEKFGFDGQASQALVIDKNKKVWFTDIPEQSIGYFDPKTQETSTIKLPEITPDEERTIPISLEVDNNNNIWISVVTKGVILKYYQDTQEFEEYVLPDRQSGPFDITIGPQGMIWFTESNAGKIGMINPNTKEITEIDSDITLASPEALLFDLNENLWITEHTDPAITKYNKLFDTFERIPVINPDSLPFGMALDRYGNIWFAQHQIDFLGIYDPHNNNMMEVAIPTETSFVQFIVADQSGQNIWFAEAEGNKIGVAKIVEVPVSQEQLLQDTESNRDNDFKIEYTELASPLIGLGIIVTSLLFIKNVENKRRLNKKILGID